MLHFRSAILPRRALAMPSPIPSAASLEAFRTLVAQVTNTIADAPLDATLEARLNAWAPAGSATYSALLAACQSAIAEGWMCSREGGASATAGC
jgi:hypothetical protein